MYAGWVSASGAVCAGPHDLPAEVARDDIYGFLMETLLSTTKDLSVDGMIAMVMKGGDAAVNTMWSLWMGSTPPPAAIRKS